jgi:hypothetical protein
VFNNDPLIRPIKFEDEPIGLILIFDFLSFRFVGYLEEQAVITYTNILEDLDAGL